VPCEHLPEARIDPPDWPPHGAVECDCEGGTVPHAECKGTGVSEFDADGPCGCTRPGWRPAPLKEWCHKCHGDCYYFPEGNEK